MSAQHTPGPWKKEYDCGFYNIEAPAPDEPGKTFLVACSVSERDLPLILAAPELLEALLEAWPYVPDHHGPVQARIRAAIAKATGQQGGAA